MALSFCSSVRCASALALAESAAAFAPAFGSSASARLAAAFGSLEPCGSAADVAVPATSFASFLTIGMALLICARMLPVLISGFSCHVLSAAGLSICESCSSDGLILSAALLAASPAISRRRTDASLTLKHGQLAASYFELVEDLRNLRNWPLVIRSVPNVRKPSNAS